MSDLLCRCGEPWDSTGGLNFTHSDMPWWEYDQCVRGHGCPSCGGEFSADAARDLAWHRSVEFLANGSITGDPYPEYPAPCAPAYCRRPNGQVVYRGSDDEPWHDLIPKEIQERFRDSDFQLGEHPNRADIDELRPLPWLPNEEAMTWAGLWIRLLPETISDRDDVPVMERANGIALRATLEEHGLPHWFLDTEGAFWIGIGWIRYGTWTPFPSTLQVVEDVLHTMESHPLLDDDTYDTLVAEKKQEVFEEFLENNGLAEFAGVSGEVMKTFLESRSGDILGRIELDKWGKVATEPDDAFYRGIVTAAFAPQHHEILRASGNLTCLLLYQKGFDLMAPRYGDIGDRGPGIMIFYRNLEAGSKIGIELRPVPTVNLDEFRKPGHSLALNYVVWGTLCSELRGVILDVIAGREPDADVNYSWWPHDIR